MRVAFNGTYGDAPWTNVVWFFITGSGTITQADLNAFTAFAAEAWGGNLVAHMNGLSTLTLTHAILYSTDLEDLESTHTSAFAGSLSGTPQPASAAICVSWHIAVSYRGGHPRSYIAGVNGTQLSSLRLLTPTAASTLAAGANTFHTNMEGFTAPSIPSVEHGVISFVRAKAWRTPPVFYRITNASCDQRLDTQRRRLGPDLPG